MIINIFGQPGSGKSTLSKKVKQLINERYPAEHVLIIDGDFVRKASSNFDYSYSGRKANITYAYHIATNVMNAGKVDPEFKPIVILALVSPFLRSREELKEDNDVIEVFLQSSRNLRIENHVEDFERPTKECININTDNNDVTSAAFMIMDEYLYRSKYANRTINVKA